MATTFVDYDGDGNATKSFSFPSIKEADIKVEVDNVIKTVSTHYNITSYTTTGGGNIVFTAGNIPQTSANKIRIFRDTDVDTAKATFTAGSSVKAGDLNNNQTQLLYAAQEEQNQTVLTSNIKDAAVTTAKIKADQITSALIADDQINSEHYVDGSIDTAHIADLQVTTAKITDGAVTSVKLSANSVGSSAIIDGNVDTAELANSAVTTDKLNNLAVTTAKIADSNVTTVKIADTNVTTAKIAADAVTGAKIADDSINSEHYVDGSIDTAHIADSQITSAKIADGTIVAGDLASNAVTTAKIAENAVTNVELAVATVVSTNIANGNIITDKIADDAVTNAKIADDSIDSEHYVDGSIDTAHIGDSQITSIKIASNAVTTDKIADSELSTLAGMQSTTASNLASATALTASTAELNQLDGITLETSVTTSSDTRIPTSKAVNDLVLSVTNALGGFVAIANETSFPTANPDPSNNAGTVVSISQLASGLAVNGSGVATISNGAGTGNTVTITGFPSSLHSQTLPASSGLQVQTTSTLHTYTFHKQLASAADIQAISATVNSFSARYRVSASAPTSSLDGGDLWYDTTNSKLMVYSSQNSAWEESSAIGNFFISTISSSSNSGGGSATANGTAYRFTISDAPVSAQQLIVSVDGVIQKPNAGSSQPSEGFVLVGNDIIFGSAPANGASMFVTVIGSTVGIGTPSNNTVTTAILQNGSVTTAKIVDANVTTAKITDANVTTAKIADDAVTSAKIADGTIVAGNIASSAITNAKIASGNVDTTALGTDAVSTVKIQDDAVTADKLASSAVVTASIVDGNVTTAKIADDAVTAAKLANTSVTAASYGSSTSIPSITVDAQGRITAASGNTVNTDLVGDTSPQLGGALDTNGSNINFGDSTGNGNTVNRLTFGTLTHGDLQIYHDGSNSYITDRGTGELRLYAAETLRIRDTDSGEEMITCNKNGSVDLYHNNSKKLETVSGGATVTGTLTANQAFFHDGGGGDPCVRIQADDQSPWALAIQNQTANTEGYKSYVDNSGNYISYLFASGAYANREVYLNNGSTSKLMVRYEGAGKSVNLYNDGNKRLETTTTGIDVIGHVRETTHPHAYWWGVNNTAGVSGWKTIQWNNQRSQSGISQSNSNSRFTPSVAGWYNVIFNHNHENGVHNNYYTSIVRNSSTHETYHYQNSDLASYTSCMIYFNGSSDYVEFTTYHANSSHNCTNNYYVQMNMTFMHP